MVKINKKTQGKKNRAAGARFELKVRHDLESKGWIVDKWSNNVEFRAPNAKEVGEALQLTGSGFSAQKVGKLIPAKRKYNPFKKVMAIGTGFPDFVAFKRSFQYDKIVNPHYPKCPDAEVMGVEAKSNGYLDPKERAKCKWLLDNNVFSKVLVVRKGKKRGEIIYKEFDSKNQ